MRRRAVVAWLSALWLLLAGPSRADGIAAPGDATGLADLELNDESARSHCFDESAFTASVEAQVGERIVSSGLVHVTLVISHRTERQALTAVVSLKWRDALSGELQEGRQEIVARDDECAALTQAAAVTTALALTAWKWKHLRELEAVRVPATAPPRDPAHVTKPAPRALPAAPRALPAAPRARVRWGPRAELIVSRGLIPATSAGSAVAVDLLAPPFRISASASALLPTVARSSDRGGASVALHSGSLDGCLQRAFFFACGLAGASVYHAATSGTSARPTQDRALVGFVGMGAGAELPVWPWFDVVLRTSLRVPLSRVEVARGTTLWRAPAFGGDVGIGFSVRIP